ncbi:hypothetical protein BKA62DRAFT_66401 [Auriculariales sp. MPI-PUGE-AT-0066]|nr:hypothetical protein BKA62DRAFT_66401 [Auriculariales sp. MPI-PUGE-AT-0066]
MARERDERAFGQMLAELDSIRPITVAKKRSSRLSNGGLSNDFLPPVSRVIRRYSYTTIPAIKMAIKAANPLVKKFPEHRGKRRRVRTVGKISRPFKSLDFVACMHSQIYMPSFFLRLLERERDNANETQAKANDDMLKRFSQRERRPPAPQVSQVLYSLTRHSLFAGGLEGVPRLVLRPRRSILPFIHNVRFWPSTICYRCLLPMPSSKRCLGATTVRKRAVTGSAGALHEERDQQGGQELRAKVGRTCGRVGRRSGRRLQRAARRSTRVGRVASHGVQRYCQ